MKQLLLNFLFFVGAALVFIQCAKLFPTTDAPPGPDLTSSLKPANAVYDKQNKSPVTIANATGIELNPKNEMIWPFLTNSVFPYRVMFYMNGHPSFYNPYINFTYYDLVNKYKHTPKKSK